MQAIFAEPSWIIQGHLTKICILKLLRAIVFQIAITFHQLEESLHSLKLALDTSISLLYLLRKLIITSLEAEFFLYSAFFLKKSK